MQLTDEQRAKFAELNKLIVDARKPEYPDLSENDTLEQTLEKLRAAMDVEAAAKEAKPNKCGCCDGTGLVTTSYPRGTTAREFVKERCQECNGTGIYAGPGPEAAKPDWPADEILKRES